ncbi:AgmX/PglI C-terminal domain-containing protein [Persicimonas caeni]|nr:AgmX/PglI C-terminal domain-containing protein [Persicimonas caeni]
MAKQTQGRVQQALRVGIFLEGRLIEERLLFEPQSVTIGRSSWRTDFVVPSESLPARLELFATAEGRFVLKLVDGATVRLARTAEAAVEQIEAGDGHVAIERGTRGKVTLGEVTVMFHYVERRRPPANPRLPRAFRGAWMTQLSPVSAMAIALSAVLQAGFVVWVLNQEWPEPLEAQVFADNTFAEVLVRPKEERDRPPEPLDPSGPTEEGEHGEPGEAPPAESAASEQPTDSEPSEPVDRLRMTEQVEKETIIGVIGSRNADGDNAVDEILAMSEEMDVEGAFAGAGKVRRGQVGEERMAGSGRDDDGPGKTVGVGGLERTSGARQAGQGVQTGQKDEEEVECRGCSVSIPEDSPSGSTPPALAAEVSEQIRRIKSRIESCYVRRVKQYPSLSGKVVITFTVEARGSRGQVSDARVSVDKVGHGVGKCVAREIKRIRLRGAPQVPAVFNKAFVFDTGR